MELDPWSAISRSIPTTLTEIDPKFAQLEAAKKALTLFQSQDASNPFIKIALAAAEGDVDDILSLLSDPQNVKFLNEQDNSGLYPLMYSVVFDNVEITEIILSKSKESLNLIDSLYGYTALMWGVYFNRQEIVVELLNHGADLDVVGKNGLTVYDLIKPNSDMYDFFEQHGLFERKKNREGNGGNVFGDNNDDNENINDNENGFGDDSFYKNSNILEKSINENDDELLNKIRLQTAGLTLNSYDDQTNEDFIYRDSNNFTDANNLNSEQGFNFQKLLKNQYIIFSDYDISTILEFTLNLHKKYPHKTKYPAAIIFQCVRYANHVKDNDTLVENFLNLAFTQIRSTTSTKSGVTNLYNDGDIVLQSYWLSVVNFLYYYLCKDDGFFKKYPKVLQELIVTLNSLIIELTNSLKFKLNDLIDDCLLNFTNIPDISKTLYKNDWNFFKNKKSTQTKSTYDEIYQLLYPPSIKQQLKPSPIKIIQTLGALLYVLDLHSVHPLITQQTLSIVFQWLSLTLFNRIISQKKYLSRNKAIQIRLNISVLEDWTRSNNRHPKLPEIDKDILANFPYTLIEETLKTQTNNSFNGVCKYKGDDKNPFDLSFYHNTLFNVGKLQFEPLYELLQWLQCFTSLKDEDSLNALLESLNKLNDSQLLKIIDKYRYELDEDKFDKSLKILIQKRKKNINQTLPNVNYSSTSSSSDENIYLNQDFSYPLALPTIPELVEEYGAGIGGVNKERSYQFQPLLPYEIIDSIDEIHDQKSTRRLQEFQEDVDKINENFEDKIVFSEEDEHKDDGLFQPLQVPTSLVHKDWGDDDNEVNPW